MPLCVCVCVRARVCVCVCVFALLTCLREVGRSGESYAARAFPPLASTQCRSGAVQLYGALQNAAASSHLASLIAPDLLDSGFLQIEKAAAFEEAQQERLP